MNDGIPYWTGEADAQKTGVGLAETGTALYNRDNRYRRAVVAVRKTGSG